MVATDRSVNISLEDEVQMLRRKVTSLTKAGFEIDELKQELARTRQEKLNLEHSFMNQISSISQASALKNEELEGRLKESETVNKELARQLQDLATPEEVQSKLEEVNMFHQKELAHVIDKKEDDIAKMQEELSNANERKESLASELSKIKVDVASKQHEIDYLELEVKSLEGKLGGDNKNLVSDLRSRLRSAQDEASEMKQQIKAHEEEISQLQEDVSRLEQELSENTRSHQLEIESMQSQMSTFQSELAAKTKEVTKLTSDLDVGKGTSEQMSIQLIEMEDKLQQSSIELSRTKEQLAKERQQLDVERQVARRKFEALEAEVESLRGVKHNGSGASTPKTNPVIFEETSTDSSEKVRKLQQEVTELEQRYLDTSNLNQELSDKLQSLETENTRILEAAKEANQEEVSKLKQANQEEFSRLAKEKDCLSAKVRDLEEEIKSLKSSSESLQSKQEDLLRENSALRSGSKSLESSNSKLIRERDELQELRKKMEEELREAKKAKMMQLASAFSEPPKQADNQSNPPSPAKSTKSTKSLISERRSMFENKSQNLEQKARLESKPQERNKNAPKAPLIEKLRAENDTLAVEVNDLKKRLAKEQEITASFRRELAGLKSGNAEVSKYVSPTKVSFSNTTSPRFQGNGGVSSPSNGMLRSTTSEEFNSPSVSDFTQRLKSAKEASEKSLDERRASTGSRPQPSPAIDPKLSAPKRHSMPVHKDDSPTNARSIPVRGLVQTFEKRISQMSNRPSALDDLRADPPMILQSHSNTTEVSGLSQSLVTLDIEEMTELRRKLYVEREQVEELENELTRQCDINCILLNEITVLTDQVETSREKGANDFKDKAEIETLKAQIKELKDGSSSINPEEYEANQKELSRLKSEMKLLRAQIVASEAEKASLSSKLSRDEASYQEKISTMEAKICDLEKDHQELVRVQTEMEELRTQLVQVGTEKDGLVSMLEKQDDLRKEQVEDFKSQLVDYEKQVTVTREEMKSAQMQRQTESAEAARLMSQIENLKAQLCDAEAVRKHLTAEFESSTESDKAFIEQLRVENDDLRKAVTDRDEEKSTLLQACEEASSLKERIAELDTELSDARAALELQSEHEEEMSRLESMIKDLRIKKTEAEVRTESIQTEFTQRQVANEEEIERLKALLTEKTDKLTKALEERDQLESQDQELQKNFDQLREQKEEIERLKALLTEKTDKLTKALEERDQLESQDQELQKNFDQLREQKEEIERLKALLTEQTDKLTKALEERDQLESQDQELQKNFDQFREQVDQKVMEFEKTQDTDKIVIQDLKEQVTKLEDDLKETLEENEELRVKIQASDSDYFFSNMPSQNVFTKEIESLKKDLALAEASKKDIEVEYKQKVNELQDMIESLQAEIDQSSEGSDEEVQDLKETIQAREAKISQLMSERDQLVLSMNDMTGSRRDEIEELQTHLQEMSTRAANQTREVEKLKQQLQESGYRKEEMQRLREKLREMQSSMTGAENSDQSIAHELENVELRQKLREATLAKKIAEEKLKEADNSKDEAKTIQVLREKNTVLKFEVEKLSRKLKKMSIIVETGRQQKPQPSQTEEITRLAI